MVLPNFEIYSFYSSLGPYFYNKLSCLKSPHPKSDTCSPEVETDKHPDSSQLASPQVASCSETSHILNFHHLFLGSKESTSLAPQTWLHIHPQSGCPT